MGYVPVGLEKNHVEYQCNMCALRDKNSNTPYLYTYSSSELYNASHIGWKMDSPKLGENKSTQTYEICPFLLLRTHSHLLPGKCFWKLQKKSGRRRRKRERRMGEWGGIQFLGVNKGGSNMCHAVSSTLKVWHHTARHAMLISNWLGY